MLKLNKTVLQKNIFHFITTKSNKIKLSPLLTQLSDQLESKNNLLINLIFLL